VPSNSTKGEKITRRELLKSFVNYINKNIIIFIRESFGLNLSLSLSLTNCKIKAS